MGANGESGEQKYLVTWDFPKKPAGTFYRVLVDEFGTSHPGGDYYLIQRSVAVCRDDFVAGRLAALAAHFGAKVESFGIVVGGLPTEARQQAQDSVERILGQRRHNRGRKSKR